MKKDEPTLRSTERWAHFRFGVIGALLAAPPPRGQLQAQIQALADKTWRHPIEGHPFTLGFSTIERWYHKASAAKAGPVEVLKRKLRSDQGRHPALSCALVAQLTEQYRQHPSWSYQLHADNLTARIAADPALGPPPSYASVFRFMRSHGLIKRPRRGPAHSPGGQAAEARFEAREVRSFENPYVNGLWHLDFHHGSPTARSSFRRRRRMSTSRSVWPLPIGARAWRWASAIGFFPMKKSRPRRHPGLMSLPSGKPPSNPNSSPFFRSQPTGFAGGSVRFRVTAKGPRLP